MTQRVPLRQMKAAVKGWPKPSGFIIKAMRAQARSGNKEAKRWLKARGFEALRR